MRTLGFLLLAACGSSGSTGTVNGSFVDKLTNETESADVPFDLSTTMIQVIADGEVITGSGAADGSFRVEGAPTKDFLLRVGNVYYDSGSGLTSNLLQLGAITWSRPAPVFAKSASTQLAMTLNGLELWEADDNLELVDPKSGVFVFGLEGVVVPAVGATSAMKTFSYIDQAYPAPVLIESGDATFITQLTARPVAGVRARVLSRVATVTGITQIDGATTTISTALSAVPETSTAQLDFVPSKFAELIPAGTTNEGTFLAYQAQPAAVVQSFNAAPDLVLIDQPASGVAINTTIAHADPFPASWTRFWGAGITYSVSYPVPGTSLTAKRYGRIDVAQKTGVIAPVVGPPNNIRVEGETVRWDAPTIGVDYYVVFIHRLYQETGLAKSQRVAAIFTESQSVDIPPDALKTGDNFYVFVRAIKGATMIPERRTFPTGVADGMSAQVFTAP